MMTNDLSKLIFIMEALYGTTSLHVHLLNWSIHILPSYNTLGYGIRSLSVFEHGSISDIHFDLMASDEVPENDVFDSSVMSELTGDHIGPY